MKINYKLKRFLKRNTKRLIRYFIYFHLISLLSFNSFALSPYEYKDFASFVGDGRVICYLGQDDVEPFDDLRLIDYFSTSNGDNLNDITVGYNEPNTPGLYPFTSFAFSINDSSNVNVSFKPNDVLSMSETIVLDLHDAKAATSYNYYFRIIVNYDTEDGLEDSFVLQGNNVLKFSETQYHSLDNYTRIIYGVEFTQVLPSVNGRITSIRFEMYNITPSSYSLRIYGSKDIFTNNDIEPLTYYVGSVSNAPIYELPDDSAVNDYHDKEQGLLDDTDASGETSNIFKEFSGALTAFTDGLLIISSFFGPFLEVKWLRRILYVSLALGLFSFILNIGITRVTVKGDSSSQSNSSDRKMLNK